MLNAKQLGDLLARYGCDLRGDVSIEDAAKSLVTATTPGTSSQMYPYNLEEFANLLQPERTPLQTKGIYKIKGGEKGTRKEYRAITNRNVNMLSGASDEATSALDGRGGNLNFENLIRYKDFAYLSVGAELSLIEEMQAGGFDAENAYTVSSLIESMEIEERHILGSCTTALGTLSGLSTSIGGTGGTLATLATYRVAVSPINYWLYTLMTKMKTDLVPNLATAVAPFNNTPPANSRFGEGVAQSTGDLSVTLGQHITASWTDIKGAMAYAVWLSADSGTTWKLVGVSTTNTGFVIKRSTFRGLTVTKKPNTGTDQSLYDNQGRQIRLDGFYSQVVLDADVPGYLNQLTGGTLTAVGNGCGIGEINEFFAQLYSDYYFSSKWMMCGPKTGSYLSGVALGSGAPAYRWNKQVNDNGAVKGGSILKTLFNESAQAEVEILIHPLMAEGYLHFHQPEVPYQHTDFPGNMVAYNGFRYWKQYFARTRAVNRSGPWEISSYLTFLQHMPQADGVIKAIGIDVSTR